MNKQVQKSGLITGILAAVFVIFTLLVKLVDVQPIGPLGSSVGFAKLNGSFFNTFGPNKVCYVISTVGGLICLMTAALFAGIGFYQLFKRKSLNEVDKNLIAMGVIYLLFVIFYALFDKAVINYRPVLEDGALEPSYPSTHALMAVVFMGCALIECNETVTRKSSLKYIQIFCWAVMAITIFSRMFAGVHWFTDIIGGFLLGLTLVYLYKTMVLHYKAQKKENEAEKQTASAA